VHPAGDQTGNQLASLVDELDPHLRTELPEVGEVFIDVTAHRRTATTPGRRTNGRSRDCSAPTAT